MKRIYTILGTAAALLLMSVSCTDLNRLEDDLSSLENRVTVLENMLPALNSNIEALKKLSDATTINAVELKDGVYTVTLSNGEVLTLTQGSIGVGKTPVMSVGKDGNWMVDYQDGKGAVPVLSDGNKVPATGQDGITPKFSVDQEGYWIVSYDGGKKFEQVKDEAGNLVKAWPEGAAADPFFRDVRHEGSALIVVMNNGETLTLPVVPGFLCAIQDAAGMQVFKPGETKVYTVEMKGVASTFLTVPQGWSAALAEGKLTVTAPGALTKAVVADSRTDLSILAVSEQGLSTIAKIQVSTSDVPVVHTPVATAAPGEAGTNSLAFKVTVKDVTSWKYLLKKASEQAPTAEELLASGQDGAGETLVFNDLDAATAYVLYLLPLYNDEMGAVASAESATLAPVVGNDLYQAYMDGLEIEVNGQKLSLATNGEPVLLVADAPMTNMKPAIASKSAVVFLETPEGTAFMIDGYTNVEGNLAIIGRYADQKALIKPKSALKAMKGQLLLKNLEVHQSELTIGYLICNAKGGNVPAFEGVYIDACEFRNVVKPVLYLNDATVPMHDIIVKNSVFEILDLKEAKPKHIPIVNLYKVTGQSEFKNIIFENNLLYCKDGVNPVQFVNYDQKTAMTAGTWELNASICNNTVYNIPSGNGYFKFYQVKTMKMNKNIFYAEPTYDALASYNAIFYSKEQTGDGIDLGDNIAYGLAEGKNWGVTHANSTYHPAVNFMEKLPASPFQTADPATGTFVPTPEYAGYGVQNTK